MTGREARDDEREALAQAVEAQYPHHEVRPYAVRHFTAGFLAGYRKHPEPEITDEMRRKVAAAIDDTAVITPRSDFLGGSTIANVAEVADAALEAALRVPVGEGEQG
ncbi:MULTISPECIES: hypothetical protein [unclassified Microbacterium]|uniref:hypothetical protein n=1 Tax=unclassified Microbacterium TaxID=2609290 RepID=UPI00386CD44D